MRSFSTISDFFSFRCRQDPNHTAVGKVAKNTVQTLTYSQYERKVKVISRALSELGLKRGDKLAILAPSSLEWHLLDIATICQGSVVVPIYPDTFHEQIEFILKQTESKVLAVDSERTAKILAPFLTETPIERILILERIQDRESLTHRFSQHKEIHTLEELEEKGQNLEEKEAQQFPELSSEDVATIVYTSGTSGEPKGAVITHRSLCAMLKNLSQVFQGSVGPDDRTLCFLPLSHVLGRCDSFLHLPFGLQVIYAEGFDHLLSNLQEVKPTIMVAVPRIFEKIYAGVLDQIQKEGWFKQQLFQWASDISEEYFGRLQQDLAPSTRQILSRQLAYKLVYSHIYEKFGGNIRFFVSGGAPLAEEVMIFLRNANLTVLEGYGLTETIGPCAVNPIRKQIPGTVGLPIGDVMVKFAKDGEILIKSEALFREYYKNQEETAQTLVDGWFYSGDIGEITQEGHLRIKDRKKDIIITAGGKNIAPQKIENLMKTKKYISNFMVIGDRRKFLSAIVSIEKEDFRKFFDEWGVEPTIDIAQLSQLPQVKELLEEQIEDVNQQLSRYEAIKKFIIAPHNISIESGHLTPSLKLKKKRILEEFSEEIEALYT